jgi:hypothetical protein
MDALGLGAAVEVAFEADSGAAHNSPAVWFHPTWWSWP